VGVKLGLALPEGLGISVGVAGGKGVCIGNGVDVGKGVVFGGAVGVEVGGGTGVAGVRIGVGVGSGLTSRSQPDRNSTRRRTAILKFRTIANIFAGSFQSISNEHPAFIAVTSVNWRARPSVHVATSSNFRVWWAAWIPSMIRRP
jgi:hypothetical protein